MVGGCVSVTMTSKQQLAMLPDASLTLKHTVVVPGGKNEPEGSPLVSIGVPTPGQLSATVGSGYVMMAPHWLGSFSTHPQLQASPHVCTACAEPEMHAYAYVWDCTNAQQP